MANIIWSIPDIDVSYLDRILLAEDGLYKPVAASDLLQIPIHHLQAWGVKNGVYQFATTELIEFLQEEIKNLKTIEIGAGNGVLSRYLGIIGTDNFMQHTRKMKAFYSEAKQEITHPPKSIKKFEALEAVRLYRPQAVLGAFITQWGKWEHNRIGIQCSPYGVRENEILKLVKKYIMIGNKITHAGKFIFDLPHKEYGFPWLLSKAFDQSLNRIWIWNN